MATTAFEATPRPYDAPEEIPRNPEELLGEVDDRLSDGLSRMSGWLDSAYKSSRYYRSDQYRKGVAQRDKNRIRLIANFIRRDVDLIISELLDGEPVVNPVGRGGKNYELGRQLLQVLSWSRDEEENWLGDLEKAITSCVHMGEGALFEGWDQDADGGKGAPCCFHVDSRFLLWDETSTDIQHDDAQWVMWVSWERIKDLEAKYPDLKDKIEPESVDYYTTVRRSVAQEQRRGALIAPKNPDDKAWVKRMWERKVVYETVYIDQLTGEKAIVAIDGEPVELTATLYDELDEISQAQVVKTTRRKTELWETVAIGHNIIEHHISPFSETEGGHGKYPFAFFPYEMLIDEHRARGEIEFLCDTQDIRNEVVTQVLEQMFLSNVGYWHVYRGSMTPEEREKFNRLSYEPHIAIETLQGTPPPSHQGMDSRGLQAASAVLPLVKGLADDTSGIHDVDRGQVPGHIESGRAIRALQAKTSRLNLKIKRHIEMGLRRATVMRLHNIMQFMRGPRVLPVADPSTQGEKMLVITHSFVEAVAFYGLHPGENERGQATWVTPEGMPADVMLLNDQVADEVLFERVKLTLDTGREANRLERMEQAEMVLNVAGPAAIPWAAKELEWKNAEELIAAIEKRDAALQQMKQMEQFEKETGLPVMEALQMVRGVMQQAPNNQAAPAAAA